MNRDCLIGFGSNIGDRDSRFAEVIELLTQTPGIELLNRSRCIETTPIGATEKQIFFLNAVIQIRSELGPFELWRALCGIEKSLGRLRTTRWAPRTVDLDILLYGTEIITTVELSVPHPRMSFRRFVLEPACEIAPTMIHPVSGLRLEQLLQHLNKRPKCIVVVGIEARELEELLDPGDLQFEIVAAMDLEAVSTTGSLTNGSRWQFVLVSKVEELEISTSYAKLVILFTHPPAKRSRVICEELLRQSQHFRGPTLVIDGSNPATSEICAAIEAMTMI